MAAEAAVAVEVAVVGEVEVAENDVDFVFITIIMFSS